MKKLITFAAFLFLSIHPALQCRADDYHNNIDVSDIEAAPKTTSGVRGCPDCCGVNEQVENKNFSSGTDCQCFASESITFGNSAKVEKGAKLSVRAPVANMKTGFHAEDGADFDVTLGPGPVWGWGFTGGLLDSEPNDIGPDPDISDNQCDPLTKQPKKGFTCPHLMLLSMDMELAAKADENDWAHYAIAGLGTDDECGKCYQLDFRAAKDAPFPGGFGISEGGLPGKPLIVQAANSGADVQSGQFDIYMGAGGFGANNACSSDCKAGQCCGKCKGGQYGGTCDDFTLGYGCYDGGIRIDRLNAHNISPENACQSAAPGDDWVSATMRYSCIQSTRQKYHWNWQVTWKEIECPYYLIRVTGLRREDNETSGLPKPAPNLLEGSPINGYTTTMHDCCKPSCGWSEKVAADSKWSATMTCGSDGRPHLKQ